MKQLLYQRYLSAMRLYWRARGGRRIEAFNNVMKVTADTVFPSYHTHRLPKAGHKSRIVRYADYVQQHAICDFITRLESAGCGKACVIEVGAHHGAYAVILGKLLQKSGGRMIAIEPHPESFKVLQENVQLNGLDDTVICIQAGIADKAGIMSISDQGSQSQLKAEPDGVSVRVETLEGVIREQNLKKVDLLLIDVEGAELPVLQGFPWTGFPLPKIFCELHPYAFQDFGYTGKDLKNFLEQNGLRCIDMYFHEYKEFEDLDYIGPTVLMR